jgi:hypothetical protein
MVRWRSALAVLALLAACSQNEQGRAVITDRCVAGGESAQICKCLADQSSRKLDGDMFGIVVLGAQGEEAETDLLMKELTPERQVKFSATMRDIIRGCGAEGYLAAN